MILNLQKIFTSKRGTDFLIVGDPKRFRAFASFLERIFPLFYLDFKIREKNLPAKERKWLILQTENLQKESGGIIHDIQGGRFQ